LRDAIDRVVQGCPRRVAERNPETPAESFDDTQRVDQEILEQAVMDRVCGLSTGFPRPPGNDSEIGRRQDPCKMRGRVSLAIHV